MEERNEADEQLAIRRARLRAMRERHESGAKLDSAVTQAVSAGATPGPEPEPPRRLAPVRRNREAQGGKRGERKAQGGPNAPTQPAVGLMQRVAQFLSQEGPGARFVAGTPIREDRLGQVVQFLRRREATSSGQQAQRARNVLAYLTEEAAGETMVMGVNVTRAQRLVERVLSPDTQRRAGSGAANVNRPALLEGVVVERGSRENTGTTPASAEEMRELLERARRLSQELAEVQQRLHQLVVPPTPANASTETIPATPARSGEPRSEWFMDFLE